MSTAPTPADDLAAAKQDVKTATSRLEAALARDHEMVERQEDSGE